jgi:hypothetical protein
MTDFPRSRYLGRRLGDPPQREADHFIVALGAVVD